MLQFGHWSQLLPELLLGLTTIALLGLEIAQAPHRFQMRLAKISLIILLFLLILLPQSPLTLFGGLLHLSRWTTAIKIILVVAGLFISYSRKVEECAKNFEFYLINIILSGFCLVSSSNLLFILIAYHWNLLNLYFLQWTIQKKTDVPINASAFRFDIISSLLMFWGASWYIYQTQNMDLTATQALPGGTYIPSIIILLGLRRVFLGALQPSSNYNRTASDSQSLYLVFTLIQPLLELVILFKIVRPFVNAPESMAFFNFIGMIGIVTLTITNLKARQSQTEQDFLRITFSIHTGIILLAIAAGSLWGLAVAIFYCLVCLYAYLLLTTVPSRGTFDMVRFWAWANLCGLPLTAGFAARWEIFKVFVNHGLPGIIFLIFGLGNYAVTFWFYTRQIKIELESKKSFSDFATTQPVFQTLIGKVLLFIPLFILGFYWQPLLYFIEKLLAGCQ